MSPIKRYLDPTRDRPIPYGVSLNEAKYLINQDKKRIKQRNRRHLGHLAKEASQANSLPISTDRRVTLGQINIPNRLVVNPIVPAPPPVPIVVPPNSYENVDGALEELNAVIACFNGAASNCTAAFHGASTANIAKTRDEVERAATWAKNTIDVFMSAVRQQAESRIQRDNLCRQLLQQQQHQQQQQQQQQQQHQQQQQQQQ